MKTQTILLIIILLLTPTIFAQSPKPKVDSITLTEAEQKQFSELQKNENEAAERYQAALMRLVNTPVGEQSKDVHGGVQSAWLALNLMAERRAGFVARMQAEHQCKGCQIAEK